MSVDKSFDLDGRGRRGLGIPCLHLSVRTTYCVVLVYSFFSFFVSTGAVYCMHLFVLLKLLNGTYCNFEYQMTEKNGNRPGLYDWIKPQEEKSL